MTPYHFKPDWKLAPEWAKYLAFDSQGWWSWFENEPEKDYCFEEWKPRGGRHCQASDWIDWQYSLQARPEASPLVWTDPAPNASPPSSPTRSVREMIGDPRVGVSIDTKGPKWT